jgi:1-acyl-sn-glycerol-3-phosphate acyltransferase
VSEWVTFVDHRGAPVRHGSLRTYLVLAHTLSASAKVAGRDAIGRLNVEKADRIIDDWCDRIFNVSELTLEARGVEGLDPSQPYVLLCNHVSLLDTPCVFRTFPGTVRMVSKKELRRVPVFGKALESAGIVFVDRENREKAIKQLDAAKDLLASGISLWVAAEGRRSRDGRLHAFKKGGFHVALQLGVPIVPAYIHGTLDVIPPDQWGAVTGQTVRVAYGAPVPTEGKTRDDLPELMTTVRRSMLQLAEAAGAPSDVDAAPETA